MRKSLWLPLALAALVAVSGCAALPGPGDDNDTTAPPTANVTAAFDDLETLSATQVSNVELNNTTNETRTEIRLAVREDDRHEFSRVLSPAEQAGDVTVADDNASLLYDASENTVTRIQLSNDSGSFTDRGQYYARIVAAARNGSTVSAPQQGVSPLPVVPVGSAGATVDASAIAGYEVDYVGTSEVADRRAHGFRMTAVSEAAIDLNQTLWLDAEFYYPLHSEQTVTFDGQTYEFSTRVADIEFNDALPADTFDWSPPANATQETIEFDVERFDSRDALAAAATLSVPAPNLPSGYSFDSGQLAGENTTQVTAEYADDDGNTLTISKFVSDRNGSAANTGFGAGENVTVAGQNATYLVTQQSSMVSWQCGDVHYSVVGTSLDRETLLSVAESVACR